MGWRCKSWWTIESSLKLGDWCRHLPGRPFSRWEDAFCEFRGRDWQKLMMSDRGAWKALENPFIFHCLNRVRARCIHIEMITPNGADVDIAKQIRDISNAPVPARWESFCGKQRLELCGDSKLIVQWCNGRWPVRNPKFKSLIVDAMNCLDNLWQKNCEPPQRHGLWCRHVWREFNTVADALANDGKSLEDTSVHVEVSPLPSKIAALRGYWDGAHTSESTRVGVGWWIAVASDIGCDGEPVWLDPPVLRAYGQLPGHNAIIAELIAFTSLVESMDSLIAGKSLCGPYQFWDSKSHYFDDVPKPVTNLPIPVKREISDEESDLSDSSSSSSSTSSSPCSTNTLSDNTDLDTQKKKNLVQRTLAVFDENDFEPDNRELMSRVLEPFHG